MPDQPSAVATSEDIGRLVRFHEHNSAFDDAEDYALHARGIVLAARLSAIEQDTALKQSILEVDAAVNGYKEGFDVAPAFRRLHHEDVRRVLSALLSLCPRLRDG